MFPVTILIVSTVILWLLLAGWISIALYLPGMIYHRRTGKLLPWQQWACAQDLSPFGVSIVSLHYFRWGANFASFSSGLRTMYASAVLRHNEWLDNSDNLYLHILDWIDAKAQSNSDEQAKGRSKTPISRSISDIELDAISI